MRLEALGCTPRVTAVSVQPVAKEFELSIEHERTRFSVHLQSREEAILRDWRMLVRRDHTLTTNRVLPRSQLNDHVPGILIKFADELRGAVAMGGAG